MAEFSAGFILIMSLKKEDGMKKCLWERYLENDSLHISNTGDLFFNTFEDALRIQGQRILKNVMDSLKLSREEAMKICFCDMEMEK